MKNHLANHQIKNLRDILLWGEKLFKKNKIYFGHGTDNAWDEAVYLALHVLALPYDVDIKVLDRILTKDEKDKILAFFERRVKERLPAPYLTNVAWFAGKPYYVDERVLIPRSPLAELIENGFAPWGYDLDIKRILDIGTGSGCIAIACAHAFPFVKVDAIDISSDALAVAKINAEKHGVLDKVRLVKSDLFNAIPNEIYDCIITNPPYVAKEEFLTLPKEYSHEPNLALEAGEDGLDIVKRILDEASSHLSPGGILIVEVGNSEVALERCFPNKPFLWLEFECGGDGVFLLKKEDL